MPTTYEPIATTTLGTAAANITFSSIPATYTDLKIVLVANNNTADWGFFRINGDTGTNYSFTQLSGDGSSAASSQTSTVSYGAWENVNGIINTANTFQMSIFDFFSYGGSTNKTVLVETARDRNGSGNVARYVNLWRNTAAITSVLLYPNSGNFIAGTTATLYGIKAA
jgi:hypothetical protein